MPCNQVQTSVVDLDNVDTGVLADAIKRVTNGDLRKTQVFAMIDGKSIGMRLDGKKLVVSGTQDVEGVQRWAKRMYSSQVVLNASARYGWRVNANGSNKFSLQKG
jgi:ribosomal protein S6E (S10)